MTTITQSIAKQIKEYRDKNNLTQRDLAEMMGVPATTINRIESGETGITSTVLEKFCQVSGQTIHFGKAAKQSMKVFVVCDYVISKLYKLLGEEGYELTNLKLQKLLYYIQMEYLGKINRPMFEHKFIAWEHGPVHPDVYNKFKDTGKYGIDPDEIIPPTVLAKDEEEIIDLVIKELGGASAWELRELTHEEKPWKINYEYKKNNPITEDDLKSFYVEYRELMDSRDRQQYKLDDNIMPSP